MNQKRRSELVESDHGVVSASSIGLISVSSLFGLTLGTGLVIGGASVFFCTPNA